MRVLIVDPEHEAQLHLRQFLTGRGYEVMATAAGADGLSLAKSALPDLVFLDQHLPDLEGETLLSCFIAPEIGSRVVMTTARVELDKAVQAMKKGAEYFLPKPVDLEQVALILDRLEEQYKFQREGDRFRRLNGAPAADDMVGESQQITRVQRLISLLARNLSTPVLILGESGSGKELVARAIHRQSGVKGPLVEINCAALSESLLESELFGHEKGAFTDAKRTKSGLFEVADEGTIFFDELAEMPLSIQAKLLKVLDGRTFRRVGGLTDIRSNARFMGATNRDIVKMVRDGAFREDLYYRINVMPITSPPLRDRGADLSLLARYFTRLLGESMGKGRVRISPEALHCLHTFTWPGNVRELKNVIERALILADTQEILPEHLPPEIRGGDMVPSLPVTAENLRPLWQVEEEYIREVLRYTGNNHSRSATILGISRSTLLARLKRMLLPV